MAEREPVERGPMVPQRYRVGWRRRDLADTVTLGLEPVDDPIDRPAAGQFDMVWEPGVGEVPISLSGLPADAADGDGNGQGNGETLEHTIRAVGPVTAALCAKQVGDLVGVRGPFGRGWNLPLGERRDLLIVAGGLGLAPVRPVVVCALAERDRFGRVVLLVGARDPESVLYADQLEAWRGRFDVDVEVTVDTATSTWHGDVGMVTKLLDRAPVTSARTSAIVCGPEVMMRVVAGSLVDRGVPADQISLSLERNMKCAIGHCGHCQLGPLFACKDGPVVRWSQTRSLIMARER